MSKQAKCGMLLCIYITGIVMATFAILVLALTHRHIHQHPIILCIATLCSLVISGIICIESIFDQKMQIDDETIESTINKSIRIEGSFNKY